MATYQQVGNNLPNDPNRAPRSGDDPSEGSKQPQDPKKSQDQIGRKGGPGAMPDKGQQRPSQNPGGDPSSGRDTGNPHSPQSPTDPMKRDRDQSASRGTKGDPQIEDIDK